MSSLLLSNQRAAQALTDALTMGTTDADDAASEVLDELAAAVGTTPAALMVSLLLLAQPYEAFDDNAEMQFAKSSDLSTGLDWFSLADGSESVTIAAKTGCAGLVLGTVKITCASINITGQVPLRVEVTDTLISNRKALYSGVGEIEIPIAGPISSTWRAEISTSWPDSATGAASFTVTATPLAVGDTPVRRSFQKAMRSAKNLQKPALDIQKKRLARSVAAVEVRRGPPTSASAPSMSSPAAAPSRSFSRSAGVARQLMGSAIAAAPSIAQAASAALEDSATSGESTDTDSHVGDPAYGMWSNRGGRRVWLEKR